MRRSIQLLASLATRSSASAHSAESSLLRCALSINNPLATGVPAGYPSCPARCVGSTHFASSPFSTAADAVALGLESPLYPACKATVGKPAPGFTAPAVVDGEFKTLKLSDYQGKYVVLFFYPKDFTFVCPTEIIAYSDRAKEFEALNAQLIAASTDTEETHLAWIKTPRNRGGLGYMQIPILADTTKTIAAKYGVLIPEAGIALRGIFIINPEGVVEQITINSLPIGRSVDETLRLLQAIQYVKEHGEVCPANWKPGAKTMVADTDKSQDYFSQLAVEPSGEESFSTLLTPITSKRDYEAVVASGDPVCIDFYAPWCGKCRQIAPYVDELVAKHPGVKFYKFDTTSEQLEALSGQLGVKGLPTFKFYKGGKEVHTPVIGYKKKPLADAVAELAA